MSEYKHTIQCWNCASQEDYMIPVEMIVDDFASKNKCKNCGCNLRLNDGV